MRNGLVVLWMLFCSVAPATAQVSIGIGLPNVSIGINLPLYPELVRVPGYPVYYAPRLSANYFFYDGLYWVYQGDSWYASSWYNGPWWVVAPEVVPVYVLRVPVRYYRQPPVYFYGWQPNAPPRWGEHWGNDWAQRRSGWDQWNRSSAPAPAPLPVYQRQYSGDRYPRAEQQQALQGRNYRYQPRDPVVRQHYQAQRAESAPAPAQRATPAAPRERAPAPQGGQRSRPPSSAAQSAPTAPRAQPSQPRGEGAQRSAPSQAPPQNVKRSAPIQAPPQHVQRSAPTQALPPRGGPPVKQQSRPSEQGAGQHQQQAPKAHGQDSGAPGKGAGPDPRQGQGQGQEKARERADDRGRDDK